MKSLTLIFAICWASILSAQQPQFIMPIWFEDAVGNKDTIWVGGDPSASSQNLNPQFGEVAIDSPFDSIFEVRAVHDDDQDWVTSKVIIEHHDSPGQCYLPHSRIMINSKNQPVKISWDTMQLITNYPCNINTFLSPDVYIFVLQHWYEARIIYCMMTRSFIEVDFDYSEYPGIDPSELLNHNFGVEGQGIKNLPGLWFAGRWDAPYCYTLLPTIENKDDAEAPVSITPNPVKNIATIYSSSYQTIEEIKIYNAAGQFLSTYKADDAHYELSLNNYRPGLYFIKVEFDNGKSYCSKIVKE
ncbi:MAG: T9SS type A sorting domain-containing protein [Saprospiraceae bacterium]|nr:MAG: T9SS type A sorting domain-containing protein [Saprospiraceae bacterium]